LYNAVLAFIFFAAARDGLRDGLRDG